MKILHANKSGVPCLKNLGIWAIPSERANLDEIRKTKIAWADLMKDSLVKDRLVKTVPSTSNCRLDQKNDGEQKVDSSNSAGNK